MSKQSFFRNNLIVLFAFAMTPVVAIGDWYVPGGWDTGPFWDPTSNLMTDMGGGIHELTFLGQTPNTRYEFKVLGVSGDWDSHINQTGGDLDGSNMWGYSDANGNVTIRVDENSLGGTGFLRDDNRVLVSNDPTSWNVVGDFMDEAGGTMGDWNNGDPFFNMTDEGGGVYSYAATVNAAGVYNGRVVNTGTWDGFGTLGRSVNSWNWELVANNNGDTLLFTLDTGTGSVWARVQPVPEPGSLSIVALAGAGLLLRRRRR